MSVCSQGAPNVLDGQLGGWLSTERLSSYSSFPMFLWIWGEGQEELALNSSELCIFWFSIMSCYWLSKWSSWLWQIPTLTRTVLPYCHYCHLLLQPWIPTNWSKPKSRCQSTRRWEPVPTCLNGNYAWFDEVFLGFSCFCGRNQQYQYMSPIAINRYNYFEKSTHNTLISAPTLKITKIYIFRHLAKKSFNLIL